MATTEETIRCQIEALGKYEIGESNDEGMNAYAFAARHVPLDTKVFLKVYHADGETAYLFKEPRFLSEATEGRDGSGNLVEVRDAELLGDEFVLIAMEYVDGGSLLGAIRERILGQMDSIQTAVEILHGVSQLHAKELVHRDIKPANVLLQRTENGFLPKIGDFGSLARLERDQEWVQASKHSALYVPPEGWNIPSRYSKISDLYQVGLVLHEMVNGPFPYNITDAFLPRDAKALIKELGGETLEDLHAADQCSIVNAGICHLAQSGRLIEKVPMQQYVSPRLAKIIRKATAPDPNSRYSTATEFIGALHALSLPNWRSSEIDMGSIKAQFWRGFNWRICGSRTRSGSTQYQISRVREEGQKYRQWGRLYSNLKEAAAAVEDVM